MLPRRLFEPPTTMHGCAEKEELQDVLIDPGIQGAHQPACG